MGLEAGCGEIAGARSSTAAIATPPAVGRDDHSSSNPGEIRVTHGDFDWDVLFDRRILRGTATLTLERPPRGRSTRLVLDTRDLDIREVESSRDGSNWADAP